jgi:hypothetical protein
MNDQNDDTINDETYEKPEPRKIEVTIAQAEVLKITPQPGDVLFFKFKGDQWMDADINAMGKQLRTLFPANKVVVMALPHEHDLELTVAENQDKMSEIAGEPKDCSAPTGYCDTCSCGKKERIEAERKPDGSI